MFHLRSIFQTEDLIHKYNAAGKPVAAIVVEPIQAEGGDNHASPEFFQGLQQIGKRVSVIKIYIYNFSYENTYIVEKGFQSIVK